VTPDATLARLCQGRLVVVARQLAPHHAMRVAEALIEAGVPALEVTLDEPSAAKTIARLRERYEGQLIIGAGTALRVADAREAVSAGATFVVSPVYVSEVLACCEAAGVLCIPGAATPTETFRALAEGALAVKLFPASSITPAVVRDMREPFRLLRPIFMVTGGLDRARIPAYLAAGIAILGVGGAILDREALAAQTYRVITQRAREVLAAIQSAPGTGTATS